jgi:hypothetical protein
MCHFLSLILPADADEGAVRRLVAGSGRIFERIDNGHLARQLAEGEHQFITTPVCDCGTPIGSALRHRDQADPARRGRHVEKLRSRGWSQAKIDRWFLQRSTVLEREERIHRDRLRDDAEGLLPLDDWLALLRRIVAADASPRIGLLLHDYTGRLAAERIILKDRRIIPAADLSAEFLLHVAEDVVYEVCA